MNCQEAIERLPWWLNGSLEPAEQREVETHLAGCASCRQALAETRLASEVFAQHIPTAALVAYAADAADETPEGIDPGLFDLHLADCPQCAAELEMARASRLLSEHEEVPLLVPRQQPGPARQTRPARGWQVATLAASLAAALALGGMWANSQRSAGPAAHSAVFSDIETTTRGDAEEVKVFPQSAGFASLVLHPVAADTDIYRNHTFQVSDASGKVVVPESSLLRDKDGFYVVIVDLRALPVGTYLLQTYGTDGGKHQPLNTVRFVVR